MKLQAKAAADREFLSEAAWLKRCDWAAEFVDSDDFGVVEATLDAVVDIGDGYLEASLAATGIAAAEVVARLQGNFGLRDAYSDSVDKWVLQTDLDPDRGLAVKAHRALDRILSEPCELLELWHEGDQGDKWVGAVQDLKNRISA